MVAAKLHKVLELPATLEADSLYFKKLGDSFQLFTTASNGSILPLHYPAAAGAWGGVLAANKVPLGVSVTAKLNQSMDASIGEALVFTAANTATIEGLGSGADHSINYGSWQYLGRVVQPWSIDYVTMMRIV